MVQSNDKFKPGDIVIIKHDLQNKPKMLVNEIIYDKINNGKLLGVKCIWYDSDNKIQSYIYSTKDLVIIS